MVLMVSASEHPSWRMPSASCGANAMQVCGRSGVAWELISALSLHRNQVASVHALVAPGQDREAARKIAAGRQYHDLRWHRAGGDLRRRFINAITVEWTLLSSRPFGHG
jgi:hypothetical protein